MTGLHSNKTKNAFQSYGCAKTEIQGLKPEGLKNQKEPKETLRNPEKP